MTRSIKFFRYAYYMCVYMWKRKTMKISKFDCIYSRKFRIIIL